MHFCESHGYKIGTVLWGSESILKEASDSFVLLPSTLIFALPTLLLCLLHFDPIVPTLLSLLHSEWTHFPSPPFFILVMWVIATRKTSCNDNESHRLTKRKSRGQSYGAKFQSTIYAVLGSLDLFSSHQLLLETRRQLAKAFGFIN